MKIGVAGLGFMGAMHLDAYSKIEGAEIVAVSSHNAVTRSGNLTGVTGNMGGTMAVRDFSGVRKYEDWRGLVDDPEVEAIDICLPTDLHARVSEAALESGKHVLCEKPMALSPDDCQRMMRAAREAGRILMVGHVLRFWPEYEYLRHFVESGEWGRVRAATFVRRCGVPEWSRWLPDEARSGGAVVDLLLHDVDQALDLFGTPQRVAAKSIGGPDTAMATLLYPGGPEVRIQGGWFGPGTPLTMSFQVRAERAELEWSANGLTLSDTSGQPRKVEVAARDAYQAELTYFLECCQTGTQPGRCPPEASALALEVALAIKQSRAAGGAQISCANAD